MKLTVVTVFWGTFCALEICALIHTTLPAGAVNPFHETGAPPIAVPLGGITQAFGGGGATTTIHCPPVLTVLPAESVTPNCQLKVPASVGVPVASPVVVFRENMPGTSPEMPKNVYGGTPPLATRLELYGTPTCPVLAGHANVKLFDGQLSVALPSWPLMLMETVDPELVSVAVPVTLQLPTSALPKVPEAVTVRELEVAVNVTLPGTVTGELLPQVTVKL